MAGIFVCVPRMLENEGEIMWDANPIANAVYDPRIPDYPYLVYGMGIQYITDGENGRPFYDENDDGGGPIN